MINTTDSSMAIVGAGNGSHVNASRLVINQMFIASGNNSGPSTNMHATDQFHNSKGSGRLKLKKGNKTSKINIADESNAMTVRHGDTDQHNIFTGQGKS